MFQVAMSSSTSLSEEASVSSGARLQDLGCLNNPLMQQQNNGSINIFGTIDELRHQQQEPMSKKTKKRSLPGNPDPDAEVIALSPKSLLTTNRFICEICNKGFQRDQNLQLHRRGHNLPWKLKQRSNKDVIRKKAYVCPESTCIHHHPSRALGDLTGIKKHFSRKHGQKKYKCEKCSKIYAVQSDWKAHSKTCGTREYRCDCGTLFSRKDSFITHRAFCDALAAENVRVLANPQALIQPFTTTLNPTQNPNHPPQLFTFSNPNQHNSITSSIMSEITTAQLRPPMLLPPSPSASNASNTLLAPPYATLVNNFHMNAPSNASTSSAHLSATAFLQKACAVGHVVSSMPSNGIGILDGLVIGSLGHVADDMVSTGRLMGDIGTTWRRDDSLTRDFIGLTRESIYRGHSNAKCDDDGDIVNVSMNVEDMLKYAGGVGFGNTRKDTYSETDHQANMVILKPQRFA
ncbi:indeterminate-domain 12-like protein [Drosera capensis]